MHATAVTFGVMPKAPVGTGFGVVVLVAVAFGCASRSQRSSPGVQFHQPTSRNLNAFITALPHCRPARPLPSVSEILGARRRPTECVAVQGRLIQGILQSCPALVGQRPNGGPEPDVCVTGWKLWPSSALPVPERFTSTKLADGLSLLPGTGYPGCDNREVRTLGLPEKTRLAVLPAPGSGEVESVRGLSRPIVAVVGGVPGHRFKSGESTELSDPVSVDTLLPTHICVVDDGADEGRGAAPP